jgi:bis(5'-nucleosyl)-tetraphosphatase (symmetrical)
MSTYLFGDIQGCWQSLKSLLKSIDYRPAKDRLGFVGDVVNRGPHSLDVMRFITDLKDPLFVLGNHEMYFMIAARGHIPWDRYDHTLDTLLNAPDCDYLVHWLMQRPLVQPTPDNEGIIVHAGIPPQWSVAQALERSNEFEALMQQPNVDEFLQVCFGDEPNQWGESLTGPDRMRYIVNALTRLRFCTQEGELDFMEKGTSHPTKDLFKPWFEWREPDPVTLYFGHWAKLEGRCDRPNTFALDTGCIHGGSLTAIRLEDKRLFHVRKRSC